MKLNGRILIFFRWGNIQCISKSRRMLDRGIDDMEAGRELPLEDAFRKITELRDARKNARNE